MISVEDARTRILAALAATPAETVPLPAGWGRVLARPVLARLTQPPAASRARLTQPPSRSRLTQTRQPPAARG